LGSIAMGVQKKSQRNGMINFKALKFVLRAHGRGDLWIELPVAFWSHCSSWD